MLIFLQAVLGFDNLLYISIESKKVESSQQSLVRRLGIGLAIFFRIGLLFAVERLVSAFEQPFLVLGQGTENAWLQCSFNLESLIVLVGGAFIIYTAIKEIYHMVAADPDAHGDAPARRSVGTAVFWIVLMNVVFSFDSILSARALSENMIVISTAIVLSGLMMIYLADSVAEFLKRNRTYEVLGLFILLIVGVMLVSEGGHTAHLAFFGYQVEAMQKTTFYFVITVLVLVDVAQSQYQKRLLERTRTPSVDPTATQA
ncbi:MAG: tellurium resistance protein TerC [Planctomycetota bacterium]|nr:MAG: tellurium resistance protein TerC [Planctomycetota bacterium]